MATMSLHTTEEELARRITEAATEASQQAVKDLANNIVQLNLAQVPLKINPDELLLVTANFSDKTMPDQVGRIVEGIYDTFNEMGITRVIVLANTRLAKFDVSVIKEADVNEGISPGISEESCEYDGTAHLKQ